MGVETFGASLMIKSRPTLQGVGDWSDQTMFAQGLARGDGEYPEPITCSAAGQ